MRPLFEDDAAVRDTTREVRAGLPVPARTRWQPLRSGLLNLYRFDYEEFWFEDGHLLLKGNNGTGKSRVLALQLPFLLDGDISSERVEPDADQAKKMEWNLLLGMHQERAGYTWVEFGRRTGTPLNGSPRDGALPNNALPGNGQLKEEFFTIGCGLSAVAGRGTLGRWYFVTSQRVGKELFLQARSGQVLSRERLAEEIGAHGRVFATAAEYRQAIDQTLFKLGQERYDGLIDLLIKLRQPKLSRSLDEKVLSKALSEALPPLSSAILADVAESFRTLESDRQTLDTFSAANRSVDLFLAEYRRYVQIAARRRADDVRQAQAAYEQTMRNLRRAETDRDSADVEVRELAARLDALEIEEQVADTSAQTLQNSPQMADARALDGARLTMLERQKEVETANVEQLRAERQHRESEQRLSDERLQALQSQEQLQERSQAALEQASAVGLETEHRQAAHAIGLPAPSDLQVLAEARHRLNADLEKRAQAIRHVRALNQKVETAQQALSLAKQLQEGIASQLDGAVGRQREAHAAREQAVGDLIESYRTWAQTLTELAPAEPELVEEDLQSWLEAGAGECPVIAAVHSAELDAARRFATRKEQCDRQLAVASEELAELRSQYDALQAGGHEPPPPPHTRDAAAREVRPGAPLWLVCDFAPQVPEAARAGIEAALESAGLLDAWVTPEGTLLGRDEHDTVIAAGISPLAPQGRSLAGVLVPSVDRQREQAAGISDDTVRAVLQHIGSDDGAGHVWVDASGRWQIGPLQGAYSKASAGHIGQSARDARRRERMAELAREIDSAEELLTRLRAERAAVDERERAMRAEIGRAPRDDRLRQSQSALDAAVHEVRRQREQLVAAEHRTADRTRDWELMVDQRARDASDLGMTPWIENLTRYDELLQTYRSALPELWAAVQMFVHVQQRMRRAVAEAAESAEEAGRRAAGWQEAKGRAESAGEQYRVLHESVGALVEEILERLAEARRRLDEVRRARGAVAAHRSDRQSSLAVAQRDVNAFSATLERETIERDEAVAHLKAFAATRLLRLAVRETEEGELAPAASNTRVVEAARAMETELAQVAFDEAAWERSQNVIYKRTEELKTALSTQGYQPEAGTEGGVFVVSMPFLGRNLTMLELRDALSDEVASRQTLLNAKEREILENHLIGEVALHLHGLLHAAEELVQRMNEELRKRPTSAGMQLRFVWRPADDAPAGMADARKRLLRAEGAWSPAEREALGSFLQHQIQAVRAANVAGTWQDHLAEALDYRRWHFFDVERNQDGHWKRLTKRTHGTGSGGEKAIALTIPQFAAAAAHYATADENAPRLILLDEAFVGVDADMRRKCMGLLAAFDLDFVMTSEREWGCYDTLPGLAIYHLSSRPGIDAVHVSRWVWNGRERRQSQPSLPSAIRLEDRE